MLKVIPLEIQYQRIGSFYVHCLSIIILRSCTSLHCSMLARDNFKSVIPGLLESYNPITDYHQLNMANGHSISLFLTYDITCCMITLRKPTSI